MRTTVRASTLLQHQPNARTSTASVVGSLTSLLQYNGCAEHAIGIQELLSGNFTTVLLTNYMYDVPWLFSECPHLYDVPVVLVHGERGGNAMANECRGYANVTLVAPFLPIPYGTHHTKMMVVVYPEKVRVAIFTANYIAIDWGNKTQGVWHQDFELKTLSDDDDVEEKEANAATATNSSWTSQLDFEADLVGYLSCLGPKVAAFCKSEIARFDFSTATVALIPSVPGVHKGKGTWSYYTVTYGLALLVLVVSDPTLDFLAWCCYRHGEVRPPTRPQVRSMLYSLSSSKMLCPC